VRFEFDPAPPLETLMLHFCGEIRLNHWYRCAAQWHTEPVIKHLYRLISQDEARHGGAYLRYMRRDRALPGRRAARIRADRRTNGEPESRRQALHPTNLHVNKRLFPNDTVQSRLPDPRWLERWLDEQIQFDGDWEGRVSRMILKNLSSLFGQPVDDVQALNRFRKTLAVAA
jgi:hypothetical protein